jgi:hypothetical protein
VVDEAARVRLERRGDRWLVTDDLHEPDPEAALFSLTQGEILRARAILEHYARYALPLRLAASVGDSGALQLHVLQYRERISPGIVRAADLPIVPSLSRSTYELPEGMPICFRVHNAGKRRLSVTLVNVAASGRVQLLGDRSLDSETSHIFYSQGWLGSPFQMTVPDARHRCIDRLIAIGTTLPHCDLGYLSVDHRFADVLAGGGVSARTVIESARSVERVVAFTNEQLPPETDEDKDARRSARLVDDWTATQAILMTRRLRRPS